MRRPSKVIAPLRILLQSGDRAQDRRLARAVGADEGDRLALVELDRHALQRVDVIVVELDAGKGEHALMVYSPIVSSSTPR